MESSTANESKYHINVRQVNSTSDVQIPGDEEIWKLESSKAQLQDGILSVDHKEMYQAVFDHK